MPLQPIKQLDFCTCAFVLVWGVVITPSDRPRHIIHAHVHRKSLGCEDGWGRSHKRIFDLVINTISWKSSTAGYRAKSMKSRGGEKISIIVTIRYGVSNSDQHRSAVSGASYPLFSLFGLSYNEYDTFVEGSKGLKKVRLIIDWLCIKTEELKILICVFSKLWISIVVLF